MDVRAHAQVVRTVCAQIGQQLQEIVSGVVSPELVTLVVVAPHAEHVKGPTLVGVCSGPNERVEQLRVKGAAVHGRLLIGRIVLKAWIGPGIELVFQDGLGLVPVEALATVATDANAGINGHHRCVPVPVRVVGGSKAVARDRVIGLQGALAVRTGNDAGRGNDHGGLQWVKGDATLHHREIRA